MLPLTSPGPKQGWENAEEKKAAIGYLNKIPSLDALFRLYQANPDDFERRPVWARNRFLRIEALLRSDDAEKAFNQGGAEGHRRFLEHYGFKADDPLDGSHHEFLSKPHEDLYPRDEVKALGQVDNQLGIEDLAVIARITPETITHSDNISWGGYDGERTVLGWLRNPDPRFVYLRIDASHPMRTITDSKKLRRLLKERRALFDKRRKQSKKEPGRSTGMLIRPLPSPLVGPPEPLGKAMSYAFIEQLNRWSFVESVGTWLQYFRCFELHKKGSEPNIEAVAVKIYGTEDENAAVTNATQGIKRVREMIKAALDDRFPNIR